MDLELRDRVAVLTGAGGAIGGAIAEALAAEGAGIAIWDISEEAGSRRASRLRTNGAKAISCICDVTDRDAVESALAQTLRAFPTVDLLVNAAGGSRAQTTTSPDLAFFDIDQRDMEKVMALNYFSAVLPSQAVGRILAKKGEGSIVNIGSIAGGRPLTRSLTYSNAKAAIGSFTQWLAVHMAQEYSPRIRVNAVAPGFVLTDQNRFLLLDEQSGKLTARGETIISQVPMRRFGEPHEIATLALWLASPRASFLSGAVIPVDGGFTAFCGV